MPSSKSAHDLPSGATSHVVREEQIEYGFIGKLQGLKYEYRADIRDRAALERRRQDVAREAAGALGQTVSNSL